METRTLSKKIKSVILSKTWVPYVQQKKRKKGTWRHCRPCIFLSVFLEIWGFFWIVTAFQKGDACISSRWSWRCNFIHLICFSIFFQFSEISICNIRNSTPRLVALGFYREGTANRKAVIGKANFGKTEKRRKWCVVGWGASEIKNSEQKTKAVWVPVG